MPCWGFWARSCSPRTPPISRYGWLAFLGANVAMTAFAMTIGAYGLLVQQLGFTATTLLGLRRSGFELEEDVTCGPNR